MYAKLMRNANNYESEKHDIKVWKRTTLGKGNSEKRNSEQRNVNNTSENCNILKKKHTKRNILNLGKY